MLPIRKAMKQLIDMQIQGVDNNHLEEARTELQNTYDAFVKKYGRLNDKANDFLTEDIDGYTLVLWRNIKIVSLLVYRTFHKEHYQACPLI